jgi:hypothetical protein
VASLPGCAYTKNHEISDQTDRLFSDRVVADTRLSRAGVALFGDDTCRFAIT